MPSRYGCCNTANKTEQESTILLIDTLKTRIYTYIKGINIRGNPFDFRTIIWRYPAEDEDHIRWWSGGALETNEVRLTWNTIQPSHHLAFESNQSPIAHTCIWLWVKLLNLIALFLNYGNLFQPYGILIMSNQMFRIYAYIILLNQMMTMLIPLSVC